MANNCLRNLFCLMQKRFIKTSPAVSPPSPLPFTVQCLVNSCGFPMETALSVSQKIQLSEKKPQKPKSVVSFLKSQGFDDTQIVKLVEKQPGILRCEVDSNLKPKFEFLAKKGFTGAPLLYAVAGLRERALNSQLDPLFEYLRSLLGNNEDVVSAIMRYPLLLTVNVKVKLQSNVDLLINEGVPISGIRKLIILKPRVLIMSKNDTTISAVKTVKNMGLDVRGPMFMYAFRVVVSLSEETLKKKVDVFKSLGWTEEQILSAFKRYPSCFAASEDRIRNTVDFCVNTMKLKPEALIADPIILTLGIDTRLRPRNYVFKVLQSKNLIKLNTKIEWFLKLSEKNVMEKYILPHNDQIPNLLEMYSSSKVKKTNV
ncbi:uncharacterized protein LOC119989555 [Tripterygium wilfordii]|uniref:uncharacterized protein LOC119989555 n=1 Tax=Tripterygium wilfordii TaxID=458696 RepID=UPI0018F843F5|nr:uncharacterized protein LOC119989555 [Tripterygium wilfordii]XP_038691088.1 uncharacterized protein LOC119989555 [Tripterygium wilfordii]